MGYYDAYNAILSITKSTSRDSIVDLTKRVIVNDFKNNPSYYQVQITTASTPLSSTPVGSWIVDDPNKVFEVKQISLIPDVQLNYGDLVLWLGDYWLTTTVDYMGSMYYRGSIQKCYSSIKWQDSTGRIVEAYFIITKDSQRGLGILDGKEMILANERRFVAIQNNVDTLKIVKGQRFIFDNGRCFRVTSIDTLKTGIIGLELEETQIDTVLDNVSLRIANYYTNNYTISISNGSTANIITGNILQLNVITKDNGTNVSLPVTYSSSDNIIATVNSNGLVTSLQTGSVVITVALTNDSTVKTTIALTVSASVTPSYTLNISGSDFIRVTTSQPYSGSILNNGIVDNSKTIVWSLNATTLASITSQTTSSVTIKANSTNLYGNIVLVCTCVEDNSIVGQKTIAIKALF